MDKQAVYDHVKTFMLTQGAKSLSNTGGCMYISDYFGEERRCGIGCLLPKTNEARALADKIEGLSVDDIWHEAQGQSISAIDLQRVLELLDAGAEDIAFLSDIQSVHDENAVEHWHDVFPQVAVRHGLDP